MFDSSWLNLSVDGFSGKPAVLSFDLEEGVYGDDLLVVNFLSQGSLPSSIIGKEASLSFEFGGRKEFFNGVVTGCLAKQSPSSASMTTLKIKTLRHLIDKEKKHAVYCNSDIEEITRSILGKAKVSSVKYGFNSFHKADFKIQYNESDLAFLQRIFEDGGIIEFVKHSEGKSELVISDGDDFPAFASASDSIFVDSSIEITGDGNVFYGHGHVPARPGMSFDAFGETFIVCSVSHIGSQGAAFGIKDENEGYSCRVVAFSKRMLGSLPRRKAKPQVPGVIVARTEGFKDSPAALDSEGRYIIRMPFDEENPDMASSAPVHLAQSFAGENCGVHFPLRRGTPVLVAFEDGDIDKPIALGALPKDTHRGPAGDKNSFQNILRTSGGVGLVFDDKAKSLDIEAPESISSKAGKKLGLESDELSVEGKKKGVFKTAGGVKISLDDSSGVLKMEAPSDIVLKAGGKIVFQSKSVEQN